MSNPSKSELVAFLDKIKAINKRLERRAAELEEAQKDAQSFEAKLESLGTPNYKNDAAITEVATTKLKLQSCTDVIEKLEAELADLSGDIKPLINQGSQLCLKILEPVLEEIVDGVARQICPVCENIDDAKNAARSLFAAQRARRRLMHYGSMQSSLVLGPSSPAIISTTAKEIITVISEALSAGGNLQQFLTPTPATSAAAQT